MKKPSYEVIKQEMEKLFNQARQHSDYTDSMRQEIITRALSRIKESEYEVM